MINGYMIKFFMSDGFNSELFWSCTMIKRPTWRRLINIWRHQILNASNKGPKEYDRELFRPASILLVNFGDKKGSFPVSGNQRTDDRIFRYHREHQQIWESNSQETRFIRESS